MPLLDGLHLGEYKPVLRIDYSDEHVIQEISYISLAILLIHNYYISFEAQYFSSLDHISRNEIGHTLLKRQI